VAETLLASTVVVFKGWCAGGHAPIRDHAADRGMADESEQAGTAAVRMFSGMEMVVVVYCITIHLYLIGVVDGAGLANTGSRTDTPSAPGAGSLWYTYSGT
jgi:hypothetical protein